MHRSRTPRRFAAVLAVAFILGCVRVASDPASVGPVPHSTVDLALSEVRWEVQATLLRLRQKHDYWRSTYNRMSTDIHELRQRLSVDSITSSARR